MTSLVTVTAFFLMILAPCIAATRANATAEE